MSFFKNKTVIIILATAIILLAVAAVSHFTEGLPERIAGDAVTPVEKLAYKILSPIISVGKGIKSPNEYAEENERLRERITELELERKGSEDYDEENKRLRELLGIKRSMADSTTVAAEVVAYDWDNLSETIVIDKGSNDNIKLGDAVVTAEGVVGRISEVGKNWARVLTVISPKHSLGVKISRTGDLAVAEGDARLSSEGKARLGYISGEAKLIEGDIVETSGVGGIYPPNIAVGRVTEISVETSGKIEYAVIEPTAPLESVKEVLVVTEWTSESVLSDYSEETNEADAMEVSEEEVSTAEG